MSDREQLHWFTSSFSGGSGNECVECARAAGSMVVRDSKAPEGNVATFSARSWAHFLLSLQGSGHPRGPQGVR
ncbi:DUF397 domain-containing protein [Streptomyces sp. BH097]|uniref:DUF397 domain-containing protein n=1 Tax=unclassified Streptomyces TaxID=2593676 RepID=UPI003BB66C44